MPKRTNTGGHRLARTFRNVLARAVLLGGSLAGPAIAQQADEEPQAQALPFKYEYIKPSKDASLTEVYEWMRDVDLMHRLPELQNLDGALQMREQLTIAAEECGQDNAFFYQDRARIVLCYEMVRNYFTKAEEAAESAGAGDDYMVHYIEVMLRFTVLHEMGHALIALLDLPVVGREEDAADQLAAVVLLKFDDGSAGSAHDIRLASRDFDTEAADFQDSDFADEHSLGQQRYFNFLCIVYGSDPVKYAAILTEDGLPENRAERCETESAQVTWSWERLLEQHWANQDE